MALRITLKPEEKVLIGSIVLTNGSRPSEFVIEGENVPVLRAKQIMRISQVDTPCKRLYYFIQALYIRDGDRSKTTLDFLKLAQEVSAAAPSISALVAQVLIQVSSNDLYKALKTCRTLIAREKYLLDRAAQPQCDDARGSREWA